ncbi:MAG: Calx-beta domain-containing protein [Candidatus Cryptobacteroides sp.]
MKKSIKIMAGAAIVLAAASCGRLESFDHQTFATFNAVDYSVEETVGQVKVGVSLYNPTKSETKITVKAIDGKAVNGTDYEIVSPASGVLTFKPGESSQDVVVEIKNQEGVFTGTLDFSLELVSATTGVTVGNFNTASFTIKDLDHPLAAFIGNWSADVRSYDWGPEYGGISYYTLNVTILADEEDETYTKLIIQNLEPYFASNGLTAANGYNIFEGVVNDAKNQVTIPMGQPIGYKTVVLVGIDNTDLDTATAYSDIIMNLNADGTLTIPNGYGSYSGGFWECLNGPITLTKK